MWSKKSILLFSFTPPNEDERFKVKPTIKSRIPRKVVKGSIDGNTNAPVESTNRKITEFKPLIKLRDK